MSASGTTHHDTRCLKCHRILRKPSPDGLGPKCRRMVRRTARLNPPAAFKPYQLAKAIELLEMGGLVPLRSNRVYLTVSDDGSEVYRTAATGQCNCPAGLRATSPCYHGAAAHLLATARA
ncbi:hypothetical protein EES44_24495 [Streptomyces sp. ADI96-15]|uniref:hypothetical protein n=1 Tax=Streptomyces sp. ADI96-15 TaxID=1522761 RepID=UPI000F55157A|nr:hypothetical protein [Streptomyces sp. ADI96-15]RPK58095.1 hypothetical protein EES44_24495 [Streptomyces sp. ADI96-15]